MISKLNSIHPFFCAISQQSVNQFLQKNKKIILIISAILLAAGLLFARFGCLYKDSFLRKKTRKVKAPDNCEIERVRDRSISKKKEDLPQSAQSTSAQSTSESTSAQSTSVQPTGVNTNQEKPLRVVIENLIKEGQDEEAFKKALEGLEEINSPSFLLEGTVLHCLAKTGKPLAAGEAIAFVDILKQKGIDFSRQDGIGNTALLWAIANARHSMAMKLILEGKSQGIDQQGTSKKNTALHLVIAKGYKDKSAHGQSLKYSSLELVKALVDHHANVNLPNAHGNTPLHLACLRRDVETIVYLLGHGAKLGSKNKQNETPADQLNKSYTTARTILEATAAFYLLDEGNFAANLTKVQDYLATQAML